MASLRDADVTVLPGQSIVKVLHLAAVVTGDTITYNAPVKSFLVVNKTTTDACTASYSTTTHLFTVTVANTPDVDIWVLL